MLYIRWLRLDKATKLNFPEFVEMMGDTINYYDLEFSLQSAFRLEFSLKKFKISLVITFIHNFRAFDVKGQGSIDAEDLRRALEYTDVDPEGLFWDALKCFIIKSMKMSKIYSFLNAFSEARQFIMDLDIDNDGSITYEDTD